MNSVQRGLMHMKKLLTQKHAHTHIKCVINEQNKTKQALVTT